MALSVPHASLTVSFLAKLESQKQELALLRWRISDVYVS